ncbi:MAG: hypothetical protein D6694_13995 [Gammaproteobacteria bacterium]|nr:MAG: hypothetical protein D6694_13995 [Gammaproteobacteria bacterium]
MFFNQGNPRPLMHPIDCQAKWTQQVIRLKDISGLNQQGLAAISLSAKASKDGSTVPFRIELKSIRWY